MGCDTGGVRDGVDDDGTGVAVAQVVALGLGCSGCPILPWPGTLTDMLAPGCSRVESSVVSDLLTYSASRGKQKS